MSTLRAVQLGVQRYVRSGERAIATRVTGTRQTSAIKRLDIYREGYYLRLNEALGVTYPALKDLLGEKQFQALTIEYVDAHPSHHYSVRYYGNRLAHWLRRTSPYSAQPVLGELARLEWIMAYVFDAAEAAPIKRSDILKIKHRRWPHLRFVFHPATRLYATRWNTVALWQSLTNDESPPDPARSARFGSWALWRSSLEVYFVALNAYEQRALRAALRGAAFSDACACAPPNSSHAERAAWAAELLDSWLQRGWIVGYSSETQGISRPK